MISFIFGVLSGLLIGYTLGLFVNIIDWKQKHDIR